MFDLRRRTEVVVQKASFAYFLRMVFWFKEI